MKIVCKTMLVSIVVNIALVMIKLITGLICNYKSLIADAVHSFSDLSTDVVAIVGQGLADKKADDNHPYGHGRVEYITSIVIGSVILMLGINLLYGIIRTGVSESRDAGIAIVAVIFTIVFKYALAKFIKYRGEKYNNNILIASAKESMSDVLSAVCVLITVILSQFKGTIHIFKYADKLGSLIISLFIIKTAFDILKDNIKAIIGESEQDEEVIYRIKGLIMSITDVLSIDNLTVMKFGSYYQIMLDAGVDSDCNLEEAHEIAHNIEKELLNSDLKIKYVAVHINPFKKSISKN